MHPEFKTVGVFNGLPDEALEFLSSRTTVKVVPPGTVIVKEGETGDSFFLIGAGIVRVFKTAPNSVEVDLTLLGNGDFFGEMCLLETLPRSATVQADTETRLFCVSLKAFLDLYEQMPKHYSALLHNIAKDLANRLRRINEAYFKQMAGQKDSSQKSAEKPTAKAKVKRPRKKE